MTDNNNNKSSCGVFGLVKRSPILSVVGFALAGVAIGVGLTFWEPEHEGRKEVLLKWVGLLGDLFVRSLKAIVLPLIFFNVSIAIIDMMKQGAANSVGKMTMILYMFTTVTAATIGLITCLTFQGFFDKSEVEEQGPPMVMFGCNEEDSFLAEDENGTLSCTTNATAEAMEFELKDIGSAFVRNGVAYEEVSISDQLYNGVFNKLFPSNITQAFADGNFASVILFAIFFGLAMGHILMKRAAQNAGDVMNSTVASAFSEMNDILLTLINWVIELTPYAVFSMVVKAVGSQDDFVGALGNVGWLMAAIVLGFMVHFFIVDIVVHGFVIGRNPLGFLRHIIPAQVTALATASSAATIPVTLDCLKNSGEVPASIRNFVCPLGATINMDGSAIYIPAAAIWLAYQNGITPGVGDYILLIILATIGSVGSAPVPGGAFVMAVTAYNTVFGSSGTPNGLEFLIAIDWFVDKLITAMNVSGDACVAHMIAARAPLDNDEKIEETSMEESSNDDDDKMEDVELGVDE